MIRKTKKKPLIEKNLPGKAEAEPESMMEFFIGIWNQRKPGRLYERRAYANFQDWYDHTSQYRICQITGIPIENCIVHNFMHVLTKTRYSQWKFEAKNIVMGSTAIHTAQEFGGHERMEKLADRVHVQFFNEYKEFLKSEYYREGKQ